jgi:hypothetical protein
MRFLVSIIIFIILLSLGCKNDPCDNIVCKNGGTCVNGMCDCPVGYNGPDCCCYDPCYYLECVNGHSSLFSSGCFCICNSDYEGLLCEIKSRTKFLGTYAVSKSCISGLDSFYISITENNVPINRILIDNFNNSGITIQATVGRSSINIPYQIVSGDSIIGNGNTNDYGNTITLNYTLSNASISDTCTAILIKQ